MNARLGTAGMSSELSRRVAVSVTLAPVALGAAWLGGGWMLALGLVVTVLGLHEFYEMSRALRPIPLTGHLGGVAIVVVAYRDGLGWTLAVLFGLLVVTFFVSAALAARESALVSMAITVFGAVYVGYGVAFLVLLRQLHGSVEHFGFNVLLAVLLTVWASDIFAYFGGRLVGRTRLAPAISPKKTVEGLVIGLVAGTFCGWVTLYHQGLSSLQALELGAIVAVVGPIGDLFESYVKRDLGVKDSGKLLPGHGGVLDRVDALLFAGVAAFYVLVAMGKA
jgi:phosphatidate cytidylyltransferase